MKNWFNRNYKAIIIFAFLIPIITVAIVSISHVTLWYGLSNPVSWALYLSIGIEIAALSALAAISANMGSKVYFPFIVVTLIQFIGNIFFAYSYIDVQSKMFIDWVDLVSPLLEFIGVEPNDYVSHKRFLALFAGGMLPIISLSFLHMLVKFTEEDRVEEEKLLVDEHKSLIDKHIIEEEIEKYKHEQEKINASDLIGEISRVRLSEEDLKRIEEFLASRPKPTENFDKIIKAHDDFTQNTINDVNVPVNDVIIELPKVPQEIARTEEEVVEPLDDSGSRNDYSDNSTDINSEPLIEESTISEPENQIPIDDDMIPLLEDFVPEPEDLGLFEPNEETPSEPQIEMEKKN